MKTITKKILKVELFKIENNYNKKEKTFFYNLYLDGIDEPLLLNDLKQPLQFDLVGRKIKYKINGENEVSDFEFTV
jgi:hypothetical protein